LYSILVHEGSADSGHYYSYIYDIEQKVWRKYNDINISEEVQAQVLKEAKGINYTSAYYLVYSQESSLVPGDKPPDMPLRNYELSSGEKYLQDYYSSLIPEEQKNKIAIENQQLYVEIEQYKMGSFASRVVESYAKKF
jgi:ubiquitin carboxyl-terminal hydrolase 25/28